MVFCVSLPCKFRVTADSCSVEKCPIHDKLAACVLDFMSHITEQLSKEYPKTKTFSISYPKAFAYPAKFRPKLSQQLLVH